MGTKAKAVNELPLEILTEIFLICRANATEASPFIPFYHCTRRAPMLMTHVRQEWRSLCLSMPKLWSSISFHSHIPVQTHNQGALVLEWLRRSGDTEPLDIDASSLSTNEEAINAVFEQKHRFRMLCLHPGVALHSVRSFFSSPPNVTPNLTAVVLVAMSWVPPKFSSMQALRQLCLPRFDAFVSHSFPPQFPVEQLTHLTLDSDSRVYVTDYIAILRRCKEAKHIVFGRVVTGSEDSEPDDDDGSSDEQLPEKATSPLEAPFEVPQLESLTLSLGTRTTLTSVLRPIRCPSLRQLSIIDSRFCADYEEDLPILDVFVQASVTLQQVKMCDPTDGGSWEQARNFLLLPPIQTIPEVEYRLALPLIDEGTVKMERKFRCPVLECDQIHIGWSGRPGTHLGTDDIVDKPLWRTACFDESDALTREEIHRDRPLKLKFLGSGTGDVMEFQVVENLRE